MERITNKYGTYKANYSKKKITSFSPLKKLVFRSQDELDLYCDNLKKEYQDNLQILEKYRVNPTNKIVLYRSWNIRPQLRINHVLNDLTNLDLNIKFYPKQDKTINRYALNDKSDLFEVIYKAGNFYSSKNYYHGTWDNRHNWRDKVLLATEQRVKKFVNFDKGKNNV